MEEKEKYNKLLSRYKNGIEAMADVKDNKEEEQKYLKELEKIQLAMNDCLMKIGEYTDEETANGFDLTTTKSEIVANDKVKVVETEIVENDIKEAITPAIHQTTKPIMNTMENYKNNWELAKQLSKSDLVPDTFKGKVENCIIALGIAQQTNLPPYTIMNNLNIVRGRASFSGSFCKTLVERTGKYLSLDIKYFGEKGKDTFGAYMEAVRKDGNIIKGPEVTIDMAKKEGWYSKKDKYGKETSKWTTMPDLMLAYRATAFFARVYEPSALNGVYTTDELEDIYSAPREVEDVL